MSSTFGRIFTLTTYGESHGSGLGGVVDGCPAGLRLDESMLQAELDKRRPGTGSIAATTRKEPDTVHLLSGVFEGLSTGTPIAFHIANTDQHSQDYTTLAKVWRPGHADITYDAKYGLRDYRGGGRSSGRETASRVAGGAIALAFLSTLGIEVRAFTIELGGHPAPEGSAADSESLPYFAPSKEAAALWDTVVQKTRAAGDTLGGVVQIEALGVPAGLGEPVFHKLDAMLAQALMSVGAVKGVEVGAGFATARMPGSCNNDLLLPGDPVLWASNNAGGILGGISTGAPIVLRAAVKAIPSIALEQHTTNCEGEPTTLRIGGRHDICAIPRVVPVLKAMTALVLADMVLLQRRMNTNSSFVFPKDSSLSKGTVLPQSTKTATKTVSKPYGGPL